MKPTVTYVTPGQRYDLDDDDDLDAGGLVPYSAQQAAGLVRRSGPTFVAADPKPITPTRIEVLPPAPMSPPDTGQPARAQSSVTGDYVNRAKGFALVTNGLGLTLGVLAVIVAVAAWNVPLLSVAALLWFAGLYTLTWLVAYVVHVAVSAEGAALLHVRRGWRWLDREQAHRHELERHANGLDRGRR